MSSRTPEFNESRGALVCSLSEQQRGRAELECAKNGTFSGWWPSQEPAVSLRPLTIKECASTFPARSISCRSLLRSHFFKTGEVMQGPVRRHAYPYILQRVGDPGILISIPVRSWHTFYLLDWLSFLLLQVLHIDCSGLRLREDAGLSSLCYLAIISLLASQAV